MFASDGTFGAELAAVLVADVLGSADGFVAAGFAVAPLAGGACATVAATAQARSAIAARRDAVVDLTG
jgi:hypothetical protein